MLIIDYNAIAISNFVAQKLEPEEDLLRHMILNSIRMHRRTFKAKYGEVIIATDGMKNWRYQAFPHYKYKRKESRKDSNIDWNQVFEITNKVLDEIDQHFPYKVVRNNRCEADDIIATLVESTQEFGNYEPVMIVSGDKDFAQLQKYDNVNQYSPILKKHIQCAEPRRQLLEMILKGDIADGIPNVLSTDTVFVDGVRQTPLRQKNIDQLVADPRSLGEEVYRNFQRNQKLIDLSETPKDIKQEIINTFQQQGDKSENKKKVLNYLVANRCARLIESIGDFV